MPLFTFLSRQPRPKTPQHLLTGRRGEQIAVLHLKSLGYRIVDQNVRIAKDEIDIIAIDPFDKVLVFVEVKAQERDSPDFRPELHFTKKKKENILRAARRWVAAKRYSGGYRMDLICVTGGAVREHFVEVEI